MILSASRRTDIPSFYSKWFMNRLKEGFAYVRNPMNYRTVSKVRITPHNVDCIVFWTKDPKPLMKYLDDIEKWGYKYYFQFTLTPYEQEIEGNVRDKKEIAETLKELSSRIGKERVILRYDPILVTNKYTAEYHCMFFDKLCESLKDSTERIVISFLDGYRKIKKAVDTFKIEELSDTDCYSIAGELADIAGSHGLSIETCAEKVDLSSLNITHSKCIDGDLIERIIGCPIRGKDKKAGDREACGCMKSIDIGHYDTCIHNCIYCYANINKERAKANYNAHDPFSPILFGEYRNDDISVRQDVESCKMIDWQGHY